MYIYNYDNITKEYLGFRAADADPEETRKQEHFVPLIPANAVLTAPPEYSDFDEIPVFEGGEWVIKPDYRKNFLKSDYNLNIYPVVTIGEQEGFIIVDKETGEDIKAHKDYYKIVNDEIIKKTDEEIAADELEKAKQTKVYENDYTRDSVINGGVVYKNVLFDSDTDQKVNLIGISQEMSDTDTIVWFGKNNDALECTKEDLENIGALITQLQTFCWTRNAEIKHAISLAETIEEVTEIVIDYTMPEEEE